MSIYLKDLNHFNGKNWNGEFVIRLEESIVEVLINLLTVKKFSQYFLRHSDDMIIQTNLNYFYAHFQKLDSLAAFQRYKSSMMAEAENFKKKIFQTSSSIEANDDEIIDALLNLFNDIFYKFADN